MEFQSSYFIFVRLLVIVTLLLLECWFLLCCSHETHNAAQENCMQSNTLLFWIRNMTKYAFTSSFFEADFESAFFELIRR
jgi:hypothetical protein